jgi:hypothetical protein
MDRAVGGDGRRQCRADADLDGMARVADTTLLGVEATAYQPE